MQKKKKNVPSAPVEPVFLIRACFFPPNLPFRPLQQALHCKNMQKARELWDSIMTKGNAKYANMWLEYYGLERSGSHAIRINRSEMRCRVCAHHHDVVVPHDVISRQRKQTAFVAPLSLASTELIVTEVYGFLFRVQVFITPVSRSYGDAAHCRKALHRAVQCTSDYPEHVCEVLLTFERVEGKCWIKSMAWFFLFFCA